MATKSSRKTLTSRQNRVGYLFLAPWLFGFFLFVFFPFLYTIYLSFFDVVKSIFGWTLNYVGMNNYVVALFQNTNFLPALIGFLTIELTYVPAILILSFILAMLLNQKIKYRTLFRLIYFFPVIVLAGPTIDNLIASYTTTMVDVQTTLLFRMVFNYSPLLAFLLQGLFNNLAIVLWFTGIPIVLFLNGLQKINPQLYEAADLDGATKWQSLWKITLPLMKSTALIVSIFTVVQIAIYNINPLYGFVVKAITTRFQDGLGFAAAVSFLFSLVVFLFVGIAFWLLGDHEKEVMVENIEQTDQYKRRLISRRMARSKMTFRQRIEYDVREWVSKLGKRQGGDQHED